MLQRRADDFRLMKPLLINYSCLMFGAEFVRTMVDDSSDEAVFTWDRLWHPEKRPLRSVRTVVNAGVRSRREGSCSSWFEW